MTLGWQSEEEREQRAREDQSGHGNPWIPPTATLLPFSSLCRKGKECEGSGREFWGIERYLNPDGSTGEEERGKEKADYQLSLLFPTDH